MQLSFEEFKKALKDDYLIKLNIIDFSETQEKEKFNEFAGDDGQMNFLEFVDWIFDALDASADSDSDSESEYDELDSPVKGQENEEKANAEKEKAFEQYDFIKLANKLPAGSAFMQTKLRDKLFNTWDINKDASISKDETVKGLLNFWKVSKKHPASH